MRVVLERITPEADGRMTADVQIRRASDNLLLRRVSVQGTDADEIAAEVRRKLDKYRTAAAQADQVAAGVAARLDAINSEVAK